jgi:hypothetical protein
VLLNISSFSILLPSILGIIFWNRLVKIQKLFLCFIGFSLVVETISAYTYFNDIENHILFEIFLICDLLFFTWFFSKTNKFPKWLKFFTWGILLFVPCWEILIRLIDHQQRIESLFYILIFFYFVLQSRQVILNLFSNLEISPFKNYLFWIASARLMYYSFILFIYIYPNLRINSFNNEIFTQAFIVINTTANVLCNIMYGISFYERK